MPSEECIVLLDVVTEVVDPSLVGLNLFERFEIWDIGFCLVGFRSLDVGGGDRMDNVHYLVREVVVVD